MPAKSRTVETDGYAADRGIVQTVAEFFGGKEQQESEQVKRPMDRAKDRRVCLHARSAASHRSKSKPNPGRMQ